MLMHPYKGGTATIIDIDRFGSAAERTLTVLFHSEKHGYFGVSQYSSRYGGAGFSFIHIPDSIESPKLSMFPVESNAYDIPGWFHAEFEYDMHTRPFLYCGLQLKLRD